MNNFCIARGASAVTPATLTTIFTEDPAVPLGQAKALLRLLATAHEDATTGDGELGAVSHTVQAAALDGIYALIEVSEAIAGGR